MSGPLRIGSVCTGYGGLDLAVEEVFGGELVWVADPDEGAAAILAERFPGVPNLGDIRAVNWQDVPPVDVYIGGYPCQPFSDAGRQRGTADERHIWPWIADSLRVLRPALAVFENVEGHLRRGFTDVLADLAGLGFDAEWGVTAAADVGAPHRRKRLFVLATAAAAADAPHERHQRGRQARHGWAGPAHGRGPAAHPGRLGRGTHLGHLPPGKPHPDRRPPADTGGAGLALEPDRHQLPPAERSGRQPGLHDRWGRYAPAVHRWEHTLGRPAPDPTDALGRLNPPFVEWMMGLPDGWVTDVPGLSRTQQLRALGNGVLPHQAATALRGLANRAFGTVPTEVAA